jgi:hypothetical protein
MDKFKGNIFILFSVLLLLLFLLSFSANIRFVLKGRASQRQTDVSAENSYMFISPLQASADGQDRIRLTVFVLNDKGLGVPNRQVQLKKSPDIVVDQIQLSTDAYGRAIFDLLCNKQGEYLIEVLVDNISLSSPVTAIFN